MLPALKKEPLLPLTDFTPSQLESFSPAILKRKSVEVGIALEKRGNPAGTWSDSGLKM